ncbi:MAG: sigma-70 family RNA polymerase sigma factor [Prevotella sp.]|nr:sigma-70 family RNA polymerase sigma factor [Prevotella sp.]
MNASQFKTLFLPVAAQMYGVAMRLTGNRQEAEDLVQEAFLRLWTRRERIGRIDRPDAYATTLLRHIHCDRLRLTALRESHSTPEELPLASSEDISRAIEQADLSAQIKTLISRLPDTQRLIITLKDIEGLELADIAARTGITEGNARVILSRARKAVRAHFNRQ